jgi:allophanate hydrolase subunit 1
MDFKPKNQSGYFASRKEIVIGVRYNGIDLNNVAEYLGISTDQVIQKHTNSYWQVAFIGFAPGFAYLTNPEQVFGVFHA